MIRSGFSIAVAGDLVPSRRISVAPGEGTFTETVGWLRKADVTFGDLEMPLSDQGQPREKLIAFHASPSIMDDLPDLGFKVLSLANNHSLDYGYDALNDTIAGLDRVGIRRIGAGQDIREAEKPTIVDVNGARVGFIAWSCLLPTGGAASLERAGLAPIHIHSAYEVDAFAQMEEPGNPPVVKTWADKADLRRAVETVRELRKEVDFLAVSVHWGYGSGEALAEYQQPIGRALIDSGADVILGNHVHAIHGVEVYGGKVILYSPGNFIAQQPREGASEIALAIYDEMSPDGYLAWLEVDTDATYNIRLIPTSTNSEGLPEVAHGGTADRILERIQRLSRRLNTEISIDGEQLVVEGTAGTASRGPLGAL